MKIHYIAKELIQYETREYAPSLAASIKRIGITFPLRLKRKANGYECVDGHKRMSVICKLSEIKEVPAVIEDDGSMRTQGSWSLMNHH